MVLSTDILVLAEIALVADQRLRWTFTVGVSMYEHRCTAFIYYSNAQPIALKNTYPI